MKTEVLLWVRLLRQATEICEILLMLGCKVFCWCLEELKLKTGQLSNWTSNTKEKEKFWVCATHLKTIISKTIDHLFQIQTNVEHTQAKLSDLRFACNTLYPAKKHKTNLKWILFFCSIDFEKKCEWAQKSLIKISNDAPYWTHEKCKIMQNQSTVIILPCLKPHTLPFWNHQTSSASLPLVQDRLQHLQPPWCLLSL